MKEADVGRLLTLLFIFVFIDVLGFSLILPLLPYYAVTFAAPPTLVGLLLSANAAARFLGRRSLAAYQTASAADHY